MGNRTLEMIGNLSAEVVRLGKRLEELERANKYLEGYKQGRFDERMEKEYGAMFGEFYEPIKNPAEHTINPNPLTRDEIVEKAKSDVDELIFRYTGQIVEIIFVVNRKKRTVVALRKNFGAIGGKGKAKAAPTDCFNLHIGKAIALRRALGLEVPKEYTDAPAPEGVEIGDVVIGNRYGYYSSDKKFTLTTARDKASNSFLYAEDKYDWIYAGDIGRVIDDSDRY